MLHMGFSTTSIQSHGCRRRIAPWHRSATTHHDPLGKYWTVRPNGFGYLRDSSGFLNDHDELRARLQADGYLYLKRFFLREDVLQVRKGILARMREQDLILPSPDPLYAIAKSRAADRLHAGIG